jgi:hypothetical protein
MQSVSGRTQLLQAWDILDDSGQQRVIAYCTEDANSLASLLVEMQNLPAAILAAFAQAVHPDFVPNDYGDDPWLLATRDNPTLARKSAHRIFLSAFLIARALGHRSQNQAELARLAFEPLYKSCAQGELSVLARSVLENRLSWHFSLFPVPLSDRLLDAIKELFVERNLPARFFATICKENSLFTKLVRATAQYYLGKQYLDFVLYELDQMGSQFAGRYKLVKKFQNDPWGRSR